MFSVRTNFNYKRSVKRLYFINNRDEKYYPIPVANIPADITEIGLIIIIPFNINIYNLF